MKTIGETRRANLALLVSQWGGPTTLARRLELSGPSYLSQLANGHSEFGEKAARRIEQTLELPAGWLDAEHKEQTDGLVPELLVDAVCTVLDAPGAKDLPCAKIAQLVLMIYEDARKTGRISPPYVEQMLKLAI
jgi:hypothetical protein